LFKFPQTDLRFGKQRPALLLKKLPGYYDDWLICMISTKIHQHISGFDEIIQQDTEDFLQSGLKTESVIRISRIAVIAGEVLLGTIGEISPGRLLRIKNNLAEWIRNKD